MRGNFISLRVKNFYFDVDKIKKKKNYDKAKNADFH